MAKALADMEEPEEDDEDPFDLQFWKKGKVDQKWNFSCLSFHFQGLTTRNNQSKINYLEFRLRNNN